MPEFTPITTQEDLDRVIKDRLDRHTKTVTAEVEKKYQGYISPEEKTKLTQQITDLTQARDAAQADAKKAQASALRLRIAGEKHLPQELADRLRGDTEEELRADAEGLSKLVAPHSAAPLADPEGEPKDTKDSALRDMLSSLKN